jgi:hypothetical protein
MVKGWIEGRSFILKWLQNGNLRQMHPTRNQTMNLQSHLYGDGILTYGSRTRRILRTTSQRLIRGEIATCISRL